MIELYINMNHYDDDEYFETIDEESYGCVCMCVGGGDGGLACKTLLAVCDRGIRR